jgi:hypothetical protein
MGFFEIGSRELFSMAVFELPSYLSLPLPIWSARVEQIGKGSSKEKAV